MAPPPVGWDPVLLISQIVSMQSLHYLTLSFIIPPLLSLLTESNSLTYDGGAANIGMIMDWREMAGRPTHGRMDSYAGAWRGGQKFDTWQDELVNDPDPLRGWIIAFCWMLASVADIYFLYTLVRRPRLILDFSLTLLFNHLVLTTYYAASIPTSLFFWLVMFAGCAVMIVFAEQLCVKREMAEGLVVSAPRDEADEMELGELRRD